MKKKRFIIGVGISLAVVMMLSIWGPEKVSAQKCSMIRITDQGKPTKVTAVDPETLVVSAGDCVFWANISKDLVKVRFMGSEACVVNPAGFDCQESKKSFAVRRVLSTRQALIARNRRKALLPAILDEAKRGVYK